MDHRAGRRLGERVEPMGAGVKTYQYLRIGMVGIVALLAVSVVIEALHTPGDHCLQHSISAYYFTPVRTIFVGGLMAIGAALIFISGRTLVEDVLLSIAGLLAPVVAIIPTTEVGSCFSTDPPAQPIVGGQLADWVVAGIDNNIPALLIMGPISLVALALLDAWKNHRSPWAAFAGSAWSTKAALVVIAGVLVGGWWAYRRWDGFLDHAHAYSAIAMFGFLTLAVAANAWIDLGAHRGWFRTYLLIALAMPATGLAIWLFGGEWDHAVLGLEAIEIGLFALFWGLQTIRRWNETV